MDNMKQAQRKVASVSHTISQQQLGLVPRSPNSSWPFPTLQTASKAQGLDLCKNVVKSQSNEEITVFHNNIDFSAYQETTFPLSVLAKYYTFSHRKVGIISMSSVFGIMPMFDLFHTHKLPSCLFSAFSPFILCDCGVDGWKVDLLCFV